MILSCSCLSLVASGLRSFSSFLTLTDPRSESLKISTGLTTAILVSAYAAVNALAKTHIDKANFFH